MQAINPNASLGGIRFLTRRTIPFLFLALAAPSAAAQITFSIDWHGPTNGLPDGGGNVPITEGDILVPPGYMPDLGPLGQPDIMVPAVALGLTGERVEVDAFSFGCDGPAPHVAGTVSGHWWYSVDEYAFGLVEPGIAPYVYSEGVWGAMEGSADVFVDGKLPPGPLPPSIIGGPHTAAIDGNGFRGASGFAYRGTGLLEHNPPEAPPDLGDNLDALDADGLFPPLPGIYFSLDSGFIDPMTGVPNSGSAGAHGFAGGDVLLGGSGTAPVIYAPSHLLGLNQFAADVDDLDALALLENGIPGYQPSQFPHDWLNGATDMLLFSVRRGSAVIGQPDSIFGAPIAPGDVLTTPLPPAHGGLSAFPGIFIAAENLGLARNGPVHFGDDLDGLDVVPHPVYDRDGDSVEDAWAIASGAVPDCNRNGVPDGYDISSGASFDGNHNGIPDECEYLMGFYCTAKVNSLGCTPIIGAFGTASMTNPASFDVSVVNVVSNKPGIFFYGFAPAAIPFQGGWLCVQPPLKRMPPQSSSGVFPPSSCTGFFTVDMNARIQSGVDPFLFPGQIVFQQGWYRDPSSSTAGTGLSDAVGYTIAP